MYILHIDKTQANIKGMVILAYHMHVFRGYPEESYESHTKKESLVQINIQSHQCSYLFTGNAQAEKNESELNAIINLCSDVRISLNIHCAKWSESSIKQNS